MPGIDLVIVWWPVIAIAGFILLLLMMRRLARPEPCLCHLLKQEAVRRRGAHCMSCHKAGRCECRKQKAEFTT